MKIEKISMALHFLPFSSAMTDFLVTCTVFGEKKKIKKTLRRCESGDASYLSLLLVIVVQISLYDTLKAKLQQKYIYEGQQKFQKIFNKYIPSKCIKIY